MIIPFNNGIGTFSVAVPFTVLVDPGEKLELIVHLAGRAGRMKASKALWDKSTSIINELFWSGMCWINDDK